MKKEFSNVLANFMLNEVKSTMNKYKLTIDEIFEIVSEKELCEVIQLYYEEKITKNILKDIWNSQFYKLNENNSK